MLGIALMSILFSIILNIAPSSSSSVHAQKTNTNTTSPINDPTITNAKNTTLTSQPTDIDASTITTISIVKGAASPNNGQFYVPKEANIVSGVTVKWINDDPIPHTVTSGTPEKTTKEFDSGLMSKGQTFDHTFSKAGSFDYYCIPHPWMIGTVIVS
jgi:plastocyanin